MTLHSVFFDHHELQPSKVICIGRNYVEHIKELNNETPTRPVIFLKPNSSVSHAIYTHETDEIHYEAEICFLIHHGKIQGVGFGLDLTKRELQSQLKEKGLPWERSKAFDRSAVFSRFTEIPNLIKDIRLELWINDTLVQQGSVDLMINKPQQLFEEAQSFMTCLDGDILMTGTPKGVGIINKNDVFKGKIFSGQTEIIESIWTVA